MEVGNRFFSSKNAGLSTQLYNVSLLTGGLTQSNTFTESFQAVNSVVNLIFKVIDVFSFRRCMKYNGINF